MTDTKTKGSAAPQKRRKSSVTQSHYVPDARQSRRRRRRMLTLLALCGGILIVIAACIAIPYAAIGARDTHVVYIPKQATGGMLRDSLSKYFGTDYATKVLTLMHTDDNSTVTRGGAYEVKRGMSALKTAHMLRRGAQTPVRLTINGFRDLGLLTSRFARKLETDSASLAEAMADTAMLSRLGLTRDQRMALFIDDSYDVLWDDAPEQIMQRFTSHYDKVWNAERRKKAEDLGVTPAEVMIICSIIDEETNNMQEKGTIGRLYINRLKKGMRLQACPTARFAAGDFSVHRITHEMTNIDSPYNTYRVDGLPPGPIRTTSVRTIDALLNSKPTNALYMCAKEDFSGTHYFSADYATHEAHARRYQQELNKRGINK